MATIYSNRNDSTSTHTTVDPNVTTTWAGSVVPIATDQVYVVGRRTTINQSNFSKWTGTKTITVASTSYFATSGFFYTVTDRGQIVKINYTSTTSTTFIGCTLDESDPFYAWTDTAGVIFNGSYVHNPAYIIEVGAGETFECNELIIQEGGWLFVNGGTLKINQGLIVRDGRLVGRGNGQIIISRNSNGCNGSYIGYLNTENYILSVVDIDGGEVRTFGSTTADAVKGDTSVVVTGIANGNFAVGDDIAIYQEDDYRRRNNGYTGYRDVTANFKNMDEGFDVCGVSGNTIYLALKNGARGDIKEVIPNGSQKIVNVQPNSIYFAAGDKIIIDNNSYTIDSVEDSEFQVYYYDFTNVSTSLSDFWVNDATHVYSSGWAIDPGIGLKNTSGTYRELVNKYLWERDIIVEAEISPLSGYLNGTRGTSQFGILTSYDPAFRWGHRGNDSFKSDYFSINDSADNICFYLRAMSNYGNNKISRDTTLQTATRTACKYTIDNRKAKTTVYVNGSKLTTEFRRDGDYKGLFGIFCNDVNFRCKSLTIKLPTQKLYITTTNSISVGSIVYQSGMENDHPSRSKVVKLASRNLGIGGHGSHEDLAFAYKGQDGSGEWPLMVQINGSNATNTSLPYLHNHDFNIDYYLDFGNAQTAKSVTIDLGSQKTFTHVSFVPRIQDYGTYYGFNGVAIYGSNNLSTWTTLYGPTNDTKFWYAGSFNRMAYYPTGTASYRYVKFETKGASYSPYTNRYVNIGVHDFSNGYTISVNNSSDFNVGDKITVLTDCGYYWGSREVEAYYSWLYSTPTDPEAFWQGGWLPECTITAKNGNILTLDHPIFWGYIEDKDSVTVVKVNRNFQVSGTMGPTNSTNDWRWPNITLNGGSNVGRIHLFKNLRFNYIGSYRYSSSGYDNRGLLIRSYDYWNAALFDGCVHMMSQDAVPQGGVLVSTGHAIFRNSVSIGGYATYAVYYAPSYTGTAFFNNKISHCVNGIYSTQCKAFACNYNEVATCDSGIGFYDFRVDRMIIPFPIEIRRNFVKGTSNRGFGCQCETWGGGIRAPRIKFEYNKVRATDDYAISAAGSNAWPHMGSDFFSEHTGSRMSRYRNEGFISQGDTSSDLNYANMLKNFGRYNYDLIHGVFNIYERNPDWPDILRVYNPNGDDYLAMLGIELDILEDNVPFQVYVQFDYRYPRLARLQSDGAYSGQLKCYSLQHGTWLENSFGVTPSLAGIGWNTFSYKFDSFAAQEGKAAVYLTRDAQNSYIEFRNSIAYVLTDDPQKIRIIGNSFKIPNIWDQYHEIRDMMPLSVNGTQTIKVNSLKL